MKSSYGFSANMSYVENDGKYDLGFNFADTNKHNLDKRLSGNVENIEDDLTAAIIELFFDLLGTKKEEQKSASLPVTKERVAVKTGDKYEFIDDMFESRMRELDKKVSDLETQVNSMKTSKPIVEEQVDKSKTKKATPHAVHKNDEIDKFIRQLILLGL